MAFFLSYNKQHKNPEVHGHNGSEPILLQQHKNPEVLISYGHNNGSEPILLLLN